MSYSETDFGCKAKRIKLPAPGPGTHRDISVLSYGAEGARPKVYIQTALHADEIPGTLVIHHLRKLLDTAAKEGRILGEIIVVPVANPIGMCQRIQGNLSGRLNFNDGKNYNRHYPDILPTVIELVEGLLTQDVAQNDAVIRKAMMQAINKLADQSESDAHRKILLSLCADSDYCFDLHCDLEAILYLYSNGLNPDVADELCAQLGCEVHLIDSNNTFCFDGAISMVWLGLSKRFPDFPIPMGCMSCTIELRGQSDVSDDLAINDANNLFQFLVNQGIVEGVKKTTPPAKCQATPLAGKIYIHSPQTGVLSFKTKPGDKVDKGDIVAILIDPLANSTESRVDLTTQISGTVVSRSIQRLVGPGQIIMGIAGKEAIPEQIDAYLLSD